MNLVQLVEEAVEGCWIGHRARASIAASEDSGIGSVYSPPKQSWDNNPRGKHVETVVDIAYRENVRKLQPYTSICDFD